jgi:integrase
MSAHLFRHTLATDIAQLEGVTAYEFKSWLDWSSLSQADAYLSKEGANLTRLARRRAQA